MKTVIHPASRYIPLLFGLMAGLVIGSLLVRCKSKAPEPLRPKASFRLTANNCTAPCDPGIINRSQYGTSYRWDFGDGGTATDETPAYTYKTGGTYSLKLTLTGEQNQTADTTVIVTIASQAPTAAFTVQNDNCTAACEISFLNQSQNAQSYQWEFGDGSTATEAAPKHTYAKAGTFTAKLTATGGQGKSAVATQTVTIKSQPVPVPSFLIQNDNCIAPCTVTLQNQSTDATTYSWRILTGYTVAQSGQLCANGNNCPVYRTTAELRPVQTYSVPPPLKSILVIGNNTERLVYTAELTATGPGGTQTISKNITIREPLPGADFTFDNSGSGGKVTFTNKSLNATSYLWNFGNGSTSTEIDPVGSYGSSGSYTVTLQAKNGTGTSEIKKIVGVTVVR